ncbi:hypothetical protein EPUL_004524, partial [Erysiphe pulchra]
MLGWASFDWKPDPKSFLRGISNYSIYRETIILQLECVGYHPDIRLTLLDELKLAAVIQRTVTEEVAEMIVGMRSGSAIIKLFESTYRQTGIVQVEVLWEKLSDLKYTGDCLVSFVTKFKTEARNYQSAGGQSSSTHLMILFQQAVKDKAGKWHNMVSGLSRFHEWKLEQLLQDFISSHFERIARGDGLTRNGQNKESSINNTKSGYVVPPAGVSDDYCVVSEDEESSINYSAKVLPQHFENLVNFYDKEIARRTVNSTNQESSAIVSAVGCINVAQQILSTTSMSSTSDRWLFDTGADIDATNRRTNSVPDTIVDLGPKQFPVQIGSGIVYAECVGEILLPLKGIKSERTVIRLKYVVCLKSLPLNIMSGERFYRRGGYLDQNRIVNPEGRTLTHIDTERRRFLCLHGRPKPLKLISSQKPATHKSSTSEIAKTSKSTANKVEDQKFKLAYNACYTNGIFKIADRMKWRIKNTTGIDLDPADVKSLPCEACDMGRSVKFTTKNSRQRMENKDEGWHCDVGSFSPVSLEGYEYLCLTTENISRFPNSELRQRHNLRVKRITIDGGRDWGLTFLQNFANEEEIEVIVSAPDNQYQNGVSQRGIRFVQDAAQMACYTLNFSSQSSVSDHKIPWEVYWSKMDPVKAQAKVDHLWIPESRCITHVDASHRITGEKLDAKGTRSVFFGYRGRKNKLVWLLDGGRFLVSPQVTAFESVDTDFGWTPDPQEIVRSLPSHVQERLKSRKIDYARNEDYNVPRQSPTYPLLPRGRGYDELATEIGEERRIVKIDENSCFDEEGICDAVTGRKFLGSLGSFEDIDSISILKVVRKAIENQLSNFDCNGDELFRIMVNHSDIPVYLAETIFMEQFPYLKEYFISRPEAARKFGYLEEGFIELRKPLYGLKRSGACWQEKVRSVMKRKGFEALISDNAIYRNKKAKIIVASYADDFLLIGPNKSELQSLTKSLNEEVAITDLGDANWFLGVRIRRSSDIGFTLIDQSQYLERSFQDLKILIGRQIQTPMSLNIKIDMKKNNGKATASELYSFQRLVGKYIFSSCMIRCDTAQATSQMARFMCNPSSHHYQHMLRIPQYLSGCPEKGLLYKKNHRHLNDFGNYGLHCIVDSSFGDDYNTVKSTT